jgi:hypothetical protein
MNELDFARFKKSLSQLSTNENRSEATFNHRIFSIQKRPDGQFFPSELKPNGILYYGVLPDGPSHGTFDHKKRDVLLRRYNKNPNGFAEYLAEVDIDIKKTCRSTPSCTANSILFASFDDAILALKAAIESNRPYKEHNDVKPQKESREDALKRLHTSLKYHKNQIIKEPETPSLLGSATNIWGSISQDIRESLLSYINNPTLEGWDEVHCILVTPSLTLWQAVVGVAPSTPRCGSGFNASNIPTKETVEQALMRAVRTHNEKYLASIRELEQRIENAGGKI